MLISKSEYMLYLKHPAWLWIKKHEKRLLPSIDEALQARFDEGNAFEPFVESLYPNLIRLGFNNYSEYLEMPNKTIEAWDNGAQVVSQGRYESDSITCISDIVSKEDDAYVLTEIKSSSSAKKEHALDLAFQKIVLEGAGFPIKKCEVAHVNSSYVRKGAINPSELVAFTDITEEVEELLEGTGSRIEQAIRVAESYDMPDPAPERAKLKSYEDWLGVRQKMQPPLPKNSIHFLPSMDAERATQLIKEGINTVDQIKDINKHHFKLISEWMEQNPDFKDNEEKQEYFAHLLRECGSNIEEISDKVIKKICTSTHIKDGIKDLNNVIID